MIPLLDPTYDVLFVYVCRGKIADVTVVWMLDIMMTLTYDFNPFNPSGVKWFHFVKMFKAILV